MRKKWIVTGLTALLLLIAFNVAYAARAITVMVKGELVQSDAQPIVKNGRVYVPLRAVSDYLQEDVAWDPDTKTASVGLEVWEQNLLENGIMRTSWVYDRNTIIRFLMAYDEMDASGKQLVSSDYDTNLIGPEVVIPQVGVGSDEGRMIDFRFVDAKVDKASNTMVVRVNIWCWPYYLEDRVEKIWDFTLDLNHFSDEYNSRPLIKKVWQVDATDIDSYALFPGLTFAGTN